MEEKGVPALDEPDAQPIREIRGDDMSGHTALPLSTEPYRLSGNNFTSLKNADGVRIAFCDTKETAEEVSKKLNSFPALVAALEAVRPYVNAGEAIIIDAALLLAKGEGK